MTHFVTKKKKKNFFSDVFIPMVISLEVQMFVALINHNHKFEKLIQIEMLQPIVFTMRKDQCFKIMKSRSFFFMIGIKSMIILMMHLSENVIE